MVPSVLTTKGKTKMENAPTIIENTISTTLSNIAGKKKFVEIMQCVSSWQIAKENMREIKTEEDYETAKRYFLAAKIGYKQFEELRKSHVDLPTKLVRNINDMFRPPRDLLSGIKDHFSRLVGNYELELERKRVEESLKAQQEIQNQVEEGNNPEKEETSSETLPEKTTTSITETEEGEKIQVRETIDVRILNPETLLKAILSVQKKNHDFTIDLVEFNMPALRKLGKSLKKIPGCQIVREGKAR